MTKTKIGIAVLTMAILGGLILDTVVFANSLVNFGNSGNRPLPAIDVHLVKKVPSSPAIEKIKGNPHNNDGPPEKKDKKGGPQKQAASGVLGNYPITGNKYAIVIGICDYPDGEKNYDLCKSDGDSLRMYKALTTLYGYDPNNIHLLKDTGGTTGPFYGETSSTTYAAPTRNNILDAINEIRTKATSEDEVVFFFSGHGADGIARDGDKERRDEGIVVHDSDDGKFDRNSQIDYIWDGELKTAFADFATDRIIFVFDTCLAGGMNDLAKEGRIINMGTSETNVACVYSSEKVRPCEMIDVDGDGDMDGEGVFTRYFVHKGMLNGEANIHDYDEDNLLYEPLQVTIEEAFDYAKKIIPSIWERQKPTISDKFYNDLLL